MKYTNNNQGTPPPPSDDDGYYSTSRRSFNKRRMELLQSPSEISKIEDEIYFTYTMVDLFHMGIREFIEFSLLGGKEILALFVFVDPFTHALDMREIKYITTTHEELCKTIRVNTTGDYILASVRHINESIMNRSFMEIMHLFGVLVQKDTDDND